MDESTTSILAQRLAEVLLLDGGKLVTAESCTGGGISFELTNIPGSSQWFERGFVTYSNDAKRELLAVPDEILEQYGAVSEQTATAMAQGAIANSHADISVAVTGIAGPDGGNKDKPVGTVCFGWSSRGGDTITTNIVFEGDRQQVRQKSVLMAIQGLLDILEAKSS